MGRRNVWAGRMCGWVECVWAGGMCVEIFSSITSHYGLRLDGCGLELETQLRRSFQIFIHRLLDIINVHKKTSDQIQKYVHVIFFIIISLSIVHVLYCYCIITANLNLPLLPLSLSLPLPLPLCLSLSLSLSYL